MLLEYIFCVLTSFFAGLNIQKYFNISSLVQNNWSSIQCTTFGSWLYPFFGPKSVSLTDNQAHCDAGKFNDMFGIHMTPHVQNIDFLHGLTDGITSTLQEFRKKFANIEQAIFRDINNIWQRIWSVYIRIVQVFIVIFQIVEKLLNLFADAIKILADQYCMLGSIWNGPIGGAARYFCFDPNTLIKMNNNIYNKIKNIKINDILFQNNKVLSVYKFLSNDVQMYIYKNILLSGNHLVKENNNWIRVNKSKISKNIKYDKKYIYNIQTSNNNIISSKNIIFGDSEECMDYLPNLQYINKILNIKNKTNNINYFDNNYNDIYLNGIFGNNKLLLNNGINKKIKNIKIGDILLDGSKIIGKCKRHIQNIKIYKYKNLILSGFDIIFYNNKWITVNNCNLFNEIKNHNIKYLYHIQTDYDFIKINDIMILNMFPISDKYSEELDNNYENYINEF